MNGWSLPPVATRLSHPRWKKVLTTVSRPIHVVERGFAAPRDAPPNRAPVQDDIDPMSPTREWGVRRHPSHVVIEVRLVAAKHQRADNDRDQGPEGRRGHHVAWRRGSADEQGPIHLHD